MENQQPEQPQAQAQPSFAGKPRQSKRDMQRLNRYNAEKAGTSWANQAEVDDKFLEAKSRRPQRRRAPPKALQQQSAPTVEATLYEGAARGSHPVQAVNSHNFDFSTFPLLVEAIFNTMAAKDSRLRRNLPFCALQHYLAEILTATIIETVIRQNNDARFGAEAFPFDVIGIDELCIPKPFSCFLQGITSSILQDGDKVYFNLPEAGIPRHRGELAHSGTFGNCDANTHNAYECYVSPYVTMRLILRTVAAHGDHNHGAWNPLPDGMFPLNGAANQNLLGYRPPEYLQGESLNAIALATFANSDDMAGRLCHSPVIMANVNNILSSYSDKFAMVKGCEPSITNPSAFIYMKVSAAQAIGTPLYLAHGSLHSVEAFGSAAANMAVFFAYKRKRANRAFGVCYTVNNAAPANWNASSNYNFEMHDNFASVFGEDYGHLRTSRFEEAALSGSGRNVDLNNWVSKVYAIKDKPR